MKQHTLEDFSDSGYECSECGQTFDSKQGRSTHVLFAHGRDALTVTVECDTCGAELDRLPSQLERGDRNFCDHDCRAVWQSDAFEGNGAPNYRGGQIDVECAWCESTMTVWPNRDDGRNHFCDVECMSEYKAEHRTGHNHNHWRGGYTLRRGIRVALPGPSWKRVRETTLERDGYECQMCGDGGDEATLDVHHIIPLMAGGTNEEWNLITLCRTCHGKAESVAEEYATFTLREVEP